VPLLVWLDTLPTKAHDKCRVRIERLKELGHELRRPEADYLRDGIYELRTKHAGVNYRMLYFFHRNVAAVVSHGLVKEQAVPPVEIDRAIERKRRFEKSPDRHTYREESHAE
jgi:phage-related protein